MTNPRPGDESSPWAERGFIACAVAGCSQRAVVHDTCQTHAAALSEHAAGRDRIGEPSGYGRFGIVDRGPDWVLCHECGRTFKRIELHLIQTHGIEVADYRDTHGLRASDSLLCQDLIDRLAEAGRERIGTEAWQRLEEAREKSHPALVEAAAESARARARAASALTGTRRPSVRQRSCRVCGTTFPVEGSRSRECCSEECWQESKTRAAGRREAATRGEPADFQRRDGTGRRLRLSAAAEAAGISVVGMRSRMRRGQLPIHAGREHWVAWWWESDL